MLRCTRPPEGCEVELLHTVLQEPLQVCLTDPPNGIDVCTGAVVLCEVTCQTAGEKKGEEWG